MKLISDAIADGCGVIDVGTDHGYLPAALAKRGYPGAIIASDIKEGPLEAAKNTARAEGVFERIRFLLCDGLDDCAPEAVDTIVIAGMGGDMICRILDRAEWTMDPRYTMLLQPMSKAGVLRYWLSCNEYGIVSEQLVEDAGRIYSLLRVQFGQDCPRLSDGELFTGRYALIHKDPLRTPFLREQLGRLEKALSGLKKGGEEESGKSVLLRESIEEIREMLAYGENPGNP